MKLRNKQTGEIITLKDEGEIALLKLVESSLPNGLSLWEEVKEPLIKDEKIRKAVRAWAEANDFERLEVTHSRGHTLRVMDENQAVEIFFFRKDGMPEIDERVYSLSELCGEEEE